MNLTSFVVAAGNSTYYAEESNFVSIESFHGFRVIY